MRISSDVNDLGHEQYWSVARTHHVDVYLDGVKQNHVIMADEEKGLLKRHPVCAAGNLVMEDEGFKVEDLKGVVVIKITPFQPRSDEALLHGKGAGLCVMPMTRPITTN